MNLDKKSKENERLIEMNKSNKELIKGLENKNQNDINE